MHTYFLSKTLLVCLSTLVLTACGGGGGGGGDTGCGGSILAPSTDANCTQPAVGSLDLSINFGAANGDDVLAGNERATLQVNANEQGAAGELVVGFVTTSGTLVESSSATINGIATVDIIGDGSGTPATVTATITLSDGVQVVDEIIVQMSSLKPKISVALRDINGVQVTQFGSDVELTAEATVVDWDGGPLKGDDAGSTISFTLGSFANTDSASAMAAFEACPVVGIKEKTDCAFVKFTSSTTPGAGNIVATTTINAIDLTATINIENTGTNDGIPDQDSFTITRRVGATDVAEGDRVVLEGDEFNNVEAFIRVDLGDFQENPVFDGTVVEFRTELGSVTPSCEIASGFCEVTFVTGEPRTPKNIGVSFRNLDDDNCPSNYIENEQVVVGPGGVAMTDYRVASVLRVKRSSSGTILTEGASYTVNANGIECGSCANGQLLQMTYRRLWLDEENDGSTAHLMLTPGVASEPFLQVKNIPCLATSRDNIEGIIGSIDPAASTLVTGVGTRFLSELAAGDRIKVGNQTRTVSTITSDTRLSVTSAFTDASIDTSPDRIAAPAYFGGLGQPFGGRSTILAWSQGEESFDDTNGNGEYDSGEPFSDLAEAFLDKNEDGVMGHTSGDSASAGTLGPYRDAGLGTNPATNSEVRLKKSPFCYGTDSTETDKYCYQDGGEEETFIDANGNGLMDVGNGIYNGSRCINPIQNGTTVCSTDLIDVRRKILVSLAGSTAKTSFRASGSNGLGGTFGGGEVIQGIENRSGIALVDDAGSPTSWISLSAPNPNPAPAPPTIFSTTLSNNLPGFPLGGAQIDTTGLDVPIAPFPPAPAPSPVTTDSDEEVSLFRITNPFSTTRAVYEVSFDFDVGSDGINRAGAIDLFIGGTLQVDNCTGNTFPPILPVTCTVSGLTGAETGDLLFVVGEAAGGNFSVQGTINNVQITGTTTGTNGEFRSTELLVSNNTAVTNITEFSLSEDPLSNKTVFPGVSERSAPSGNVPAIYTTQTSGVLWLSDRFNGQLPDGTTVRLDSNRATGCALTSVGGQAVNGNTSALFTIGRDIDFELSFSVTQGGGDAGSISSTVTTPTGKQTLDSISCNLLN